ncbi:MAG: hypothetical protein ACTHK4_16705 [Mycobacteriales bacterium]
MTTDPGSGAPAAGVPAPAQGVPAAPQPAPVQDPMAALVDIRNQVIRLGQEIVAMRSEAPQGSDAMNSVTAELREAVRFLAERLDGVARMVAQRGEELADTRGALGDIDDHVRSQAETIGVLTTGMQALPSYGQQVSALQDNLNVLQQRLANIEGSIGQRLGGIEQAVARPTDASVSERLSAIEGMLGPLAQRLAQAHSEHAASLQAVQGKLDSLESGTQAALAAPVALDDAAVAALEPKLTQIASELQSLRSDISAIAAARSSADAVPAQVDLSPLQRQLTELSGQIDRVTSAPRPADVDLTPLHQQLSQLSEQVAGVAAAPRTDATATGAAPTGDIDGAVAEAERRIKAHVDDAIMALAQTLLGRAGVGALVDAPAPPQPPAPSPAAADVDAADDTDEDEYDDYDDEDAEVAQIDFSQVDLDDDDVDTVSWERPVSDDEDDDEPGWAAPQGYDDAPSLAGVSGGSAGASNAEAPFDQDAPWGAPQPLVPPDPVSTVVPERKRRWFSW